MQAAVPAPEFADSDPPLWDGLGALTYKITTSNAQAQTYFDQGLRLAYAFNHGEAQRAFRKAQKLDPDCAMCFWGEALVLGPNINLPMQDDAVAPAYAAAQKAQALAAKATPREQALIAALVDALRAGSQGRSRAARCGLCGRHGQGRGEFPDDNEIAVLYAESVMDLSPWNYWQPGGTAPNPQSVPTRADAGARAGARPGPCRARSISTSTRSKRPTGRERAEPYADRLRGAIPGAGHLVHMPSHIYYRVGRYLDALADNKTAVGGRREISDRDQGADGRLSARLLSAQRALRRWRRRRCRATVRPSSRRPTSCAASFPTRSRAASRMVQPVKAAPYFAHAQFSTPEDDSGAAGSGRRHPLRQGASGTTRAASPMRRAAMSRPPRPRPPRSTRWNARRISRCSRPPAFRHRRAEAGAHLDRGRIAQAQKDYAAAVQRFEDAAALQDALPYTEPPFWYYPVRQSLGAALLQAGHLAEAEEQFRRALKRAPANGWSYFGLAELYKARGEADRASKLEAELAKMWIGDRQQLELSKL